MKGFSLQKRVSKFTPKKFYEINTRSQCRRDILKPITPPFFKVRLFLDVKNVFISSKRLRLSRLKLVFILNIYSKLFGQSVDTLVNNIRMYQNLEDKIGILKIKKNLHKTNNVK